MVSRIPDIEAWTFVLTSYPQLFQAVRIWQMEAKFCQFEAPINIQGLKGALQSTKRIQKEA